MFAEVIRTEYYESRFQPQRLRAPRYSGRSVTKVNPLYPIMTTQGLFIPLSEHSRPLFVPSHRKSSTVLRQRYTNFTKMIQHGFSRLTYRKRSVVHSEVPTPYSELQPLEYLLCNRSIPPILGLHFLPPACSSTPIKKSELLIAVDVTSPSRIFQHGR